MAPKVETPTIGLETLTSRENRWLKRFRAALRGHAPAEACVGVEGPRLVEEAIRSGLDVTALLVSASAEPIVTAFSDRLPPSTRLLRTSDRLFLSVSGTESPQGIAALVHPREFVFEDLLRGDVPLVAVLVGVQDPGNVGTVLRTAEAFGATGVIAARGTANPLAPKALRASAGSALRMPMIFGAAPPVVLAQLRIAGLKLYAASAGATPPVCDPSSIDFRAPCALLIGNEGSGLPPEVERSADVRVRIPLAVPVDSLNAAVAAAVLLYEASRQRNSPR